MIRVHAAPARSIRNGVVDNADASGGSMPFVLCRPMRGAKEMGFHIFKILAGGRPGALAV